MKKYTAFLYTMIISVILCGCGSTLPEMSDMETAVVTEYATNLLVKYSTLSERALLNEEELEAGIIEEAEEKERLLKVKEFEKMYLNGTEDVADTKTSDKKNEKDNDNMESTNSVAQEPAPQLSVDEFFAENNFSIDYSSYALCQSYPEADGEDVFMVVDAAPGKQLCIIKFNVNNLSADEQALDMYTKGGRFSLEIENGSTVSAQSTLLVDDLSSYIGTIPAGGTEEMVLIFEVAEDVSQMGNMNLIMKGQNGENTLTLQ